MNIIIFFPSIPEGIFKCSLSQTYESAELIFSMVFHRIKCQWHTIWEITNLNKLLFEKKEFKQYAYNSAILFWCKYMEEW